MNLKTMNLAMKPSCCAVRFVAMRISLSSHENGSNNGQKCAKWSPVLSHRFQGLGADGAKVAK